VNAEAESIIAQFGLAPLPQEGGFFRQTWVSEARRPDGRAAGSAIWFLLTGENFSALHRLRAEERWNFYAGDPVEQVQLGPGEDPVRVTVLGAEAPASRSTLVVAGGVWQGARLCVGTGRRGWALLGCTLAPAWAEEDFELGRRAALLREFPRAAEWINALTR
jgi:predicted cupin superfamily sugar epimerase